jgi:DNA-directed RNA polymerase subunit RPC12/RpoP
MTAKYRCGSCNYRFVPKGDREPRRCPYCSASNVMIDARDLVKEV